MEPKGEEQGMREGARILVIEDDPDVRFILQKSLEKIGYRVQAVESGLKGLEAMRGERFHLALVNIKMPDMGGEETIREIRKIDPQIPVVVVTGSPGWPTEELKAEIQGWVLKPFRLKELRSLVRDVLEAKRGSNCDHQMAGCATGEMKA
ncbi:MAG: response regulator [Anaerolineae bacterium]